MAEMATRRAGLSDAYHRGDLPRALVRDGRQLMREGGLDALSLRATAARAGVSAAAPYRHFADKQELLTAILTDALRDLGERLATVDRASGPDRSRLLLARFVDFVQAEPDVFRLLAAPDARRRADPEFIAAMRTVFAPLAETIVEAEPGMADGHGATDSALTIIQCLLQGLAAMIGGGYVPAKDAYLVANQLFSAIGHWSVE
jgi:AcrR family transcriptional regulator